jgi:hypothetical protein
MVFAQGLSHSYSQIVAGSRTVGSLEQLGSMASLVPSSEDFSLWSLIMVASEQSGYSWARGGTQTPAQVVQRPRQKLSSFLRLHSVTSITIYWPTTKVTQKQGEWAGIPPLNGRVLSNLWICFKTYVHSFNNIH